MWENSMRSMRKEYRDGGEILIANPQTPLDLLSQWLTDAKDAGVAEVNSMSLATVDSQGKPRNRMVLLKHLEDEEIGFFTNIESDKADEISSCNSVEGTIWWPKMERQVRIEGVASPMDRGMVGEYHQSRPRKSRIAARVSNQSRPLVSREELVRRFEEEEIRFEGEEIPLPDHWGGYLITINRVEYWSGRPSRMHERVVLTKQDGLWSQRRLYP